MINRRDILKKNFDRISDQIYSDLLFLRNFLRNERNDNIYRLSKWNEYFQQNYSDQCQSMIIRFKDRDNNRRILIKCEMGQV